ncbi:MAG: hypothetical protein WD066_06255 [Planctomycetaceae bacterium]
MKLSLRAVTCCATATAALASFGGCRSDESGSHASPAGAYSSPTVPGENYGPLPGGSYDDPPPVSAGREPYHVPPADSGADSFGIPPAPLPRTSAVSNGWTNDAAQLRRVSGEPSAESSPRTTRLGDVRHAGPATEIRPAAPRMLPLSDRGGRDITQGANDSRRASLPVPRNPVSLGYPEFIDSGESSTGSEMISLLNPFGFEPLPPARFDGATESGDHARRAERVASQPAAADPWSLPVFDDGDRGIAD